MATAYSRIGSFSTQRAKWLDRLRRHEWVALGFFAYLAMLSSWRHLASPRRLILALMPIALLVMCSRRESRSLGQQVIRDWLSPALILLGYWSLGWFGGEPMQAWQAAWLAWDRTLLHDLHLRSAIEAAGPVLPWILEISYSLVYAIPMLALGALYGCGAKRRAGDYLFTLFAGVFCAYALLPLFPSLPPRTAFPGADLPTVSTPIRAFNLWLLNHLDNSTSVFPSGHIAVALSSALGLFVTLRERVAVWLGSFVLAGLVYIATIYGRYHYAADGLASIAVVIPVFLTVRYLRASDR